MSSNQRSAVVICLGLGMSAAVAVGLARFSYALILPAMREALDWSYAEAGALNAANSAGYLAGALVAHLLSSRLGLVTTFTIGALGCAVGVLLTALPDSFAALLVLRFIPGAFGAIAFVAGGTLTARVAASMRDPSAGVGLFYTGPGLGMLFAAAALPPFLSAPGEWRAAWVALGAVAIAAALLAVAAARRVGDTRAPAAASAASEVALGPALFSYGLFAAGYIGYMTFIIAAIRDGGYSSLAAGLWWGLMGVAAVGSFTPWRRILDRADGRSLALLNGACAVGAIIPLFNASPPLLGLSLVLFAGSFLVVVAATTNMARLARRPEAWSQWIGYFTIAFGVGQIGGPMIGGWAADWAGGTDAVLVTSAALLAAAALAGLAQQPTRRAQG